jgi:hypothetical protein
MELAETFTACSHVRTESETNGCGRRKLFTSSLFICWPYVACPGVDISITLFSNSAALLWVIAKLKVIRVEAGGLLPLDQPSGTWFNCSTSSYISSAICIDEEQHSARFKIWKAIAGLILSFNAC